MIGSSRDRSTKRRPNFAALPPGPTVRANFAPHRGRGFSAAQLQVIRASLAKELTQAEFDHFMETASRTGLDPLRRQIVPLVLAKNDAQRRAMVPLATIDGLRAIAYRAGDYRPMEGPAKLIRRSAKADPDRNPLGLVRAVVEVWKRTEDGWRPVAGEAYWDEFAPLRARKAPSGWEPPSFGEGDAPGPVLLAEPWRRMGRVMLAKCAEAQALRRGWPEDLAGLYAEDELARAQVDDESTSGSRAKRIESGDEGEFGPRGRHVLAALTEDAGLTRLPITEAPAALAAAYEAAHDAAALEALIARNRDVLAQIWRIDAAGALAVKEAAERSAARLTRCGAVPREGGRT